MLEKRIGAVAVILGEEVWVIGGGDGNGSASTEILELEANDPINWKWKSGPQLLNARYIWQYQLWRFMLGDTKSNSLLPSKGVFDTF